MTDQQFPASTPDETEPAATGNDPTAPAAHDADENPLDHIGGPVTDPVLGG